MARTSADICKAENGFIVEVCKDNEDGPSERKKFVAKTQQEAQAIAGEGLSGKIKVGKKRSRKGRDPVAASSPQKRTARKRSY